MREREKGFRVKLRKGETFWDPEAKARRGISVGSQDWKEGNCAAIFPKDPGSRLEISVPLSDL